MSDLQPSLNDAGSGESKRRIGSFLIQDKLGSGAMGVVYRAVHDTSGRPAAVKVIFPELAHGTGGERFNREMAILKTFKHPNIVRFYAEGKYRGTRYFAMELVDGVTLDKILKEQGTLPWLQVARIGIELCDALQHAHDKGVVHRDLKPSNLMITQDGKLKLTDFGIAKDLDRTGLTGTGRTVGTVHYMAPEQISDTSLVSHKTDLYAVGCVLYELLTGKTPFDGNTMIALMHTIMSETAPKASSKAEVPPQLDALIDQLLSKEPAKRPWDAAAVRARLEEIAKSDWDPTKPVKKAKARADSGGGGRVSDSAGRIGGNGGGLTTEKRSKPKRYAGGYAIWEHPAVLAGMLCVALVMIGLAISWKVWGKESTAVLFERAKTLMANEDSHLRRDAEETIQELLKRPDNPDPAQVRVWDDQVLLDKAEGAARTLSNAMRRKPTTEAQKAYAETYAQVTSLRRENRFEDAARAWNAMAQSLDKDNREERGWVLLADSRAAEIRKELGDQRKEIFEQAQSIDKAIRAGEMSIAITKAKTLVERYRHLNDLKPNLKVIEDWLIQQNELPPRPDPAAPMPPPMPPPA